jgi:hypothetical protein
MEVFWGENSFARRVLNLSRRTGPNSGVHPLGRQNFALPRETALRPWNKAPCRCLSPTKLRAPVKKLAPPVRNASRLSNRNDFDPAQQEKPWAVRPDRDSLNRNPAKYSRFGTTTLV